MGKNKTILIIEQTANLSRGLEPILKKENYSVISISSQYSLGELLKGNEPDLAIIDIYIPKEFGLNILRRIKELFPCLPIISMAACSNPFIGGELSKYGIVYCMSKPFSAKHLLQKIDKLIYAKKEQCEKLSLQ